jgi:hypothetical protein
VEFHPIELLKQIVGEFDVGLVDLVDQQDGEHGRGKGFPQLAAADVIGDVVDAGIAELAVAKPRNRIIFVQPLLRFGGRFDVPLDQRRAHGLGNLMREDRLARTRLALHQQRTAQRHCRVHRHLQVGRGDIVLGAFETHLPALRWDAGGIGEGCGGRKPPAGQARTLCRASSKSHRARC